MSAEDRAARETPPESESTPEEAAEDSDQPIDLPETLTSASVDTTRTHGRVDVEQDPGASDPVSSVDETVTHADEEGVDAVAEGPDLEPTAVDRYRLRGFLGAGGMGEVFEAEDDVLARSVAIKYVRSDDGRVRPSRRDAFIREARISGQLDHPNIPPVFDLGVDENGRPYYVMRLIQGRSLKEILAERRRDPQQWSLPRLLSLFQQACLALEFAHSRGIVHLDLKPANIMVGDYGELYVVDWGLSSSRDADASEPKPVRGVRGTPAYMSPEQASVGSVLTSASDLFSLGCVLYEIATGQRAFAAAEPGGLLSVVRAGEFQRGESFEGLPKELKETIGRALELDPTDRLASARELHDLVQDFLEGTKEKARKRKEAERALRVARNELALRAERLRGSEEASAEAERARPDSWAPAVEKAACWEAEDRAIQQRTEAEEAQERATRSMFEAYGHAPDDPAVRDELGELYWDQLMDAEERGDVFQRRFFESQLRRLSIPAYDVRLRQVGEVEIAVEPPAESATLHRLDELGRVLTPVEPRPLVAGPLIRVEELPVGRWQVTLERSGYRAIVAPLLVERGRTAAFDWRFRTEEEIGPDFVQVPSGTFIMGGDPDTFMSVPRCRPHVEEFFMGRFPVVWEEYREFLQAECDRDVEAARARLPQFGAGGPSWWFIDDECRVQFAKRAALTESRSRWPALRITFHDALAYCEWRSARDGRTYALPTDAEWEKAARGVDGRLFPWGDRYDASFCKNAGSTPDRAQPDAVGRYPNDRSPYGVRDLAGSAREWCDDWFREKDNQRLVRGGSWNFGEIGAHAAYRLGCPPNISYEFIGFRLVHRPTDA